MEEEGRRLFFRYGGIHGLMHHDGVFDDYQRCGVSDQQEAEWASELADGLLRKFKKGRLVDEDFHKLVAVIRNFRLFLTLELLVDRIRNLGSDLDTFSKVLACEQILEVVQYFRKEGEGANASLEGVLENVGMIAASLSIEACTIAECYQQGMLLPGVLSEEEINKRIASINETL